jgi:putative DNA primase/helicase
MRAPDNFQASRLIKLAHDYGIEAENELWFRVLDPEAPHGKIFSFELASGPECVDRLFEKVAKVYPDAFIGATDRQDETQVVIDPEHPLSVEEIKREIPARRDIAKGRADEAPESAARPRVQSSREFVAEFLSRQKSAAQPEDPPPPPPPPPPPKDDPPPPPKDDPPPQPATAPLYSEEALALLFAHEHADKLRYVAMWGKWFLWDGRVWHEDETRKVFSLARLLCRKEAATCNKPSERKRIASAKTRAAVVSLAGEDRRLAATIGQWDADRWLLNTPGGVVDLHTGKLRPHRVNDYMTKITAFTPGGDCPRWKKFIAKVTGGDVKLAAFLKRISGYALTGSVEEHALFFLYGLGQNGKSQFLLAISGLIGDYHHQAPIEMFTESQTDRHPTELAALMGARLVTAVEPEQGRRWNETRIKQLTGGDPISARFMRQDFFKFMPQYKLFIAGNHKPGLRSVDKAISRRVNIIPFAVTIPDKEKIKDLADVMLKAGGPGILQWAIEGCLEWQKNGLAPPEVVTDATKEYLADENVLQTWLDECCIRDPKATTLSGRVYRDWKVWSEERNEFTGSNKAFTARLEGLGFQRHRTNSGIVWHGLKLASDEM